MFLFWIFWRWKIWYFWAKKLTEIWYLLITEKFLFWSFREGEIRSFFEPKSWWKDNIYSSLESSCFELFGDGKCGLFVSQQVDGKMIFTGYWEVLVLNFLLMGNTVFFQPKSWWKNDIYLVFLSFPWYSRTWEIWFFAQCFHLRAKQTLCVCVIEASLKLFWRLCSRFPVCGPDI